MKKERLIRRIRCLIYRVDKIIIHYDKKPVIEHLEYHVSVYNPNSDVGFIREHHKDYSELKKLFIESGMSDEEYRKIASQERKRWEDSRDSLKLNNLKETRDNKGVYVGNGGSNRNKVRYPKKTRSKKVWSTFYKMFPYRALCDGWDGEKSTKVSK